MKPASTKIDDFRSSQGISVPTESNYTTESDQSTSLPFYIKKDGDVAGGTSEITPNSIVPGIPLSTIIRKNDEPSLERPLIRPITLERQQLFAFPPATLDRNALGGGLIDAMTKNRRESTNTAPRLESQDIPIKPVLSNKGRPHSVGNVHKYATNQLPTEGIDDADLLNSRSSILSDAMQFLQKTMPLVKPERFPIQYTGRYSHPYTFPLPEEGQHFASATNGAKSLSGHRTFLPLRNDPPNFRVMPISPINDVHRGLDGFDTHIGRFASGVPNRMLISTQSPIPIKDVDLNGTPVVGSLLSKTTQSVTGSEFSVYPDHRKGLFLEATNHARFESHFPQTFHLPQRQESTNQPATSGNNMIATNRGNVLLENYPPPPYGIAPRPKQTQGHDLLDTDRLGSWSMGRFNEEEPNYPTPEPFRDTTTIVAILQERTTRATTGTETPFFLEKTHVIIAMRSRLATPSVQRLRLRSLETAISMAFGTVDRCRRRFAGPRTYDFVESVFGSLLQVKEAELLEFSVFTMLIR
ncbi:hypothetical protein RB195_018246 [Necator americanus]|uniref:Uncharacterized protein n=1 Tax=Necator americanus TaxID=51031 RepID=A0ABR1C8U0_NECAM